MKNATGGIAGISQKVAFDGRDVGIIPHRLESSISKNQALQANHCGHFPRPPLRLTVYVTKPGGSALAICRKCYAEALAREVSEVVRRRFYSLFTHCPRIIRSGGTMVFKSLLVGHGREGRALHDQ